MSLNEARIPARSSLTQKQKREAEAAIYGLQESILSPQSQFTAEEIERMRAMVAAHDANNRPGIREFDLNNPPKEPYVHQDFPKVVYHHKRRQARKAANEEDLAAALEAGWSKEPFPPEKLDDPELDGETAAEAAAVDAELAAARKKSKK